MARIKYTKKLGERICAELSSGKLLIDVCEMPGMPKRSTIAQWVDLHPEFADAYTRARLDGFDVMGEQVVAISDNKRRGADANRDRLRMDARKWLLSKLAAKRYGDKLDVSGSIAMTLTQAVEQSFKKPDQEPEA